MSAQSASSLSWLKWVLLPVALLFGIGLFFLLKPLPLHSGPLTIPSVMHTRPAPQWTSAVEHSRRAIQAAVATQNLPGLSVAVGAEGSLIWDEGFGWATVQSQTPVTPDTRFRIGTASTALTSAAVGLLLQDSRLTLDDEIQTHVPQFLKKPWPVTLRHLMAHTAGLPAGGGDDGPLFRKRCQQPLEALPEFAGNGLLFQPGTRYRHSNYGWVLVSAAVEAAAGRPFLSFMDDRIFHPLGMRQTGAESSTEENPEHVGEEGEDPPFATLARQLIFEPLGAGPAYPKPAGAPATFYVPGFGNGPLLRYGLHIQLPRNLSCYSGSQAFLSTPSDLVRFGLALPAGTLLQPATVRLLQAPQSLSSGQRTNHGLGWNLNTVTLAGQPIPSAGIDGEWMGHPVASFLTLPHSGIVVAVVANSPFPDVPALARNIAATFAQAVPKQSSHP